MDASLCNESLSYTIFHNQSFAVYQAADPNCTSSVTFDPMEVELKKGKHLAYLLLAPTYTLLSVLGIAGNAFVLYYFFFCSKMSKFAPPEICGAINICTVAFSDLLFSILTAYHSVGQYKGNPDYLGEVSCKLIGVDIWLTHINIWGSFAIAYQRMYALQNGQCMFQASFFVWAAFIFVSYIANYIVPTGLILSCYYKFVKYIADKKDQSKVGEAQPLQSRSEASRAVADPESANRNKPVTSRVNFDPANDMITIAVDNANEFQEAVEGVGIHRHCTNNSGESLRTMTLSEHTSDEKEPTTSKTAEDANSGREGGRGVNGAGGTNCKSFLSKDTFLQRYAISLALTIILCYTPFYNYKLLTTLDDLLLAPNYSLLQSDLIKPCMPYIGSVAFFTVNLNSVVHPIIFIILKHRSKIWAKKEAEQNKLDNTNASSLENRFGARRITGSPRLLEGSPNNPIETSDAQNSQPSWHRVDINTE